MYHKRSPSPGPAQCKRRTVSAIKDERIDRLQLLALIPDAVLQTLVLPMVCYDASSPDLVTLLSLGQPFIGRIHADDKFIEKLAASIRTEQDIAITLLCDIRASAPRDTVLGVRDALHAKLGPSIAARKWRMLVDFILVL